MWGFIRVSVVGPLLLAGGAPLDTPFGTFVPPNIAPHPTAGIGGWTIQDFATAVRHGISPQGDSYYPVFTYAFYAGLTDQDIADLWEAFRLPNGDAFGGSLAEVVLNGATYLNEGDRAAMANCLLDPKGTGTVPDPAAIAQAAPMALTIDHSRMDTINGN